MRPSDLRICRALSEPLPHLRPLGIGELLDVALKIVWRNAGTLARVVVFVVFPVQVVTALLAASASPSSLNTRSGDFNVNQPFSGSDFGAVVGYSVIAVVLSFISSSLASGACFRAIASAYLGERTDWKSSLSYALKHLHSIMWISFLASLLGGLALLACIIPGIYLWTGFAVAIPALLSEGVRGSHALGRSRALVKGLWWRVFGVVVLGYLLSSVLGGAIEGAVVAVSSVQSGQASVVGVVVNIVAGTLSSMLTTPFVAAFVTVLYFDLRVRKEAFDLQLLAQRIGVDPPAGALLAPPAPLVDGQGDEPPFWPPPPGWKPRGGEGS
jgi:hypothetical protein